MSELCLAVNTMMYQLNWKTLPGLRGLACSEFTAVEHELRITNEESRSAFRVTRSAMHCSGSSKHTLRPNGFQTMPLHLRR